MGLDLALGLHRLHKYTGFTVWTAILMLCSTLFLFYCEFSKPGTANIPCSFFIIFVYLLFSIFSFPFSSDKELLMFHIYKSKIKFKKKHRNFPNNKNTSGDLKRLELVLGGWWMKTYIGSLQTSVAQITRKCFFFSKFRYD